MKVLEDHAEKTAVPQKGFFDHFLRREEQLERVVAYVVERSYPTAGDKPPPYVL